MAPGGRFVEMGKTDVRDPADYPGISYRAFDLTEAGPDRLGEILAEVTGLLSAGDLPSLPVRGWDVRRAPEAFRHMSQARHTGKLVLTIPPDPAAPREPGSVLVTGGTGTLGGLVARHLVTSRGAGHVVLAGRSGPAARGTARLAADLAGAGASVQVTACDAADKRGAGRAAGRDPGQPSAGRGGPRGRGAGRRGDQLADPGPGRRGAAAQGGRGVEPA